MHSWVPFLKAIGRSWSRLGVGIYSRIVTSFLELDSVDCSCLVVAMGSLLLTYTLSNKNRSKILLSSSFSSTNSSDCDIGMGSKDISNTKVVSFDLNDSYEGIISSGGMTDSLSSSIDNSP